MIYLYVTPTCSSCRKAIKWFEDEKIEHKVINILSGELTKDDIFKILHNTENGFDDIISKRSKPFIDNKLDIDSMKTSELIEFILKNPTVLKRPIIVASNIVEVGYNQDDIRAFIPKDRRNYGSYCADCNDSDPATCEHKDEILMLVEEMKKAVRG